MAGDNYTEVTRRSWGGRIGGAIRGIGIGLVLVMVSVPLLFWNEGRAVKRYKTLTEGGGAVVSVTVDGIDPGNEGKLIHVMGMADTDEVLQDVDFDVRVKALRLRRNVEMYQWKESRSSETKKKLGGGTETTTTYTYDKAWSSTLISSGEFKKQDGHANPADMPVSPVEQTAGQANLGAFVLSTGQVESIDAFRKLDIEPHWSVLSRLGADARADRGGVYIGKDPVSPAVGDVRIGFEVVEPTPVSIVGQQAGNSLRSYRASTGGSIFLLREGNHSAESMFKAAETGNAITTWVLRAVGFFLVLTGFNVIMKPLSVLGDVVPFIGTIVGMGTGFVSFVLAIALSFTTIAVAWIFYRPVIGLPLLAVALGAVVWLFVKGKSVEPPPLPA